MPFCVDGALHVPCHPKSSGPSTSNIREWTGRWHVAGTTSSWMDAQFYAALSGRTSPALNAIAVYLHRGHVGALPLGWANAC